ALCFPVTPPSLSTRWTKATTSLPPRSKMPAKNHTGWRESEAVLVINTEGQIFIARYIYNNRDEVFKKFNEWVEAGNAETKHDNITHWAKLLKSPRR
ncbi:MAG: hypothetical protein V3R57_09845, partial [Candidatus Bathyarchaeia archaeon]